MSAITRRADGRYQAALQRHGTRRFVYGRTRAEVEAKLAELHRLAGGGSLPTPGQRTVADLWDHFLATVGPTLRPRTLADYRALAARSLLPSLGRLRLARLTPDHLQALYGQLQAAGLARAPSKAHRLLHRLFALAVRWRWLAENPADRVLPPTYQAPRKDLWSPVELVRFLDGTQDDPWHPLWLFLIGTGCRLSEALALRWSDADLGQGTVWIRRSLHRIGGAWVVTGPKTRSGDRCVTLPPAAIAGLRRQKVRQAAERLRAGPAWQELGLVFTGTRGQPLHQSVVQHALARWRERLGLPKLTPHGLRHLHASLLLAGGLDVPRVSRRLGHATPAVTLAVYAHALGPHDGEAAGIIARALGR